MPEHIRADLVFVGPAAVQARCRLYYVKGAVGSYPANVGQVATFADAVKALFVSSLTAVLPQTCQFSAVEARYQGPIVDFDATNTDAASAGVVPDVYYAEEVAIVMQRRTGLPGRDARGRVYLPFIPAGFVSEGAVLGSQVTLYRAIGTNMEATVSAGGTTYKPVTPSFKTFTWHDVTQVRMLSEVMSRRDRRFPRRALAIP